MDFLSKLLGACLDTTHDHPAWITDQLGTVIASNLKAHNLDLSEIDLNSQIIKINDKNYKYICQELNHGTNCYLNELKDQDEIYSQLQKSIDDLEEALNKRKSNSTSIKI